MSLSAEDEVDMVNDAQDTEEKISVPSCYGGIGAPVGREGENRGLKGYGSPARSSRRGSMSHSSCSHPLG